MKKVLSNPFVAALVGGLVVAAVLIIAGVAHKTKTTTIVEQSPLAASDTSSVSGGMTPRQIYKADAPGVVYITSTVTETQQASPFDLFGQPSSQTGTATGSGIVLDTKGDILTNDHVIANASKITVKFPSGQTVTATSIGADASDDLALLKVNAAGIALTPLTLGDSSTVQVGDPTVAIGNPFGLANTLTTGVVSALQRQIQAPNNFEIDNVIQTDAPINPGNSGGPLINALGQVIGINSQIETSGSGSDGSVGIGFAVPIDRAKVVIKALETTGKVPFAYLGLTTTSIDSTLTGLNLPVTSGALVQCVDPSTPAQKAGLQGGVGGCQTSSTGQVAVGGDIIVSVNGTAISSSSDLSNAIGAKQPGDVVSIGILRPTGSGGYTHKTLTVTLGTRPNNVASDSSTTEAP